LRSIAILLEKKTLAIAPRTGSVGLLIITPLPLCRFAAKSNRHAELVVSVPVFDFFAAATTLWAFVNGHLFKLFLIYLHFSSKNVWNILEAIYNELCGLVKKK